MSVQLNGKVDENTADAIKKLTATDNLTIAALLRRYIEKGILKYRWRLKCRGI